MMQRALYVVIGALAGYALFGAFAAFGVAAIVVNLLTPLPATYLGMRFGAALGWLTVLLTAALVFLSSGGSPTLMYFLQFGLPAGVLAWLLRQRIAWDRAVLATLGVIAGASLLGLLVMSAQQGNNPVSQAGVVIDKEVSQSMAMMQDFLADANLSSAELAEVTQAMAQMTEFLREVYAGLTITVSLFMLLSLVLLLSLFSRGRYTMPGVAFSRWKAPEPMIWVLITAGFTAMFVDNLAKVFAMNLLVIILPVYFLQGLAVLDNFFRRKALSPVFRTVGYLLVVMVNPLPLLVTCVGVFDLWVDFRKPRISNS